MEWDLAPRHDRTGADEAPKVWLEAPLIGIFGDPGQRGASHRMRHHESPSRSARAWRTVLRALGWVLVSEDRRSR